MGTPKPPATPAPTSWVAFATGRTLLDALSCVCDPDELYTSHAILLPQGWIAVVLSWMAYLLAHLAVGLSSMVLLASLVLTCLQIVITVRRLRRQARADAATSATDFDRI